MLAQFNILDCSYVLQKGSLSEYLERVFKVIKFVFVEVGLDDLIKLLQICTKMKNLLILQQLLLLCEKERSLALESANVYTHPVFIINDIGNHFNVWSQCSIEQLKPKLISSLYRQIQTLLGKTIAEIEAESPSMLKEKLGMILLEKYRREGYSSLKMLFENINHKRKKKLMDELDKVELSLRSKNDLDENDYSVFCNQLSEELNRLSNPQVNKLYEELIRINLSKRRVIKLSNKELREYLCRSITGCIMSRGCYPCLDDIRQHLKMPLVKKNLIEKINNLMVYGADKASLQMNMAQFETLINEYSRKMIHMKNQNQINHIINKAFLYNYITQKDHENACQSLTRSVSMIQSILLSKCFEHSPTLMREPNLIKSYINDILNALQSTEDDEELIKSYITKEIMKSLKSKPQLINKIYRQIDESKKIQDAAHKLKTIVNEIESNDEFLKLTLNECDLRLPAFVYDQWLSDSQDVDGRSIEEEPLLENTKSVLFHSEVDEIQLSVIDNEMDSEFMLPRSLQSGRQLVNLIRPLTSIWKTKTEEPEIVDDDDNDLNRIMMQNTEAILIQKSKQARTTSIQSDDISLELLALPLKAKVCRQKTCRISNATSGLMSKKNQTRKSIISLREDSESNIMNSADVANVISSIHVYNEAELSVKLKDRKKSQTKEENRNGESGFVVTDDVEKIQDEMRSIIEEHLVEDDRNITFVEENLDFRTDQIRDQKSLIDWQNPGNDMKISPRQKRISSIDQKGRRKSTREISQMKTRKDNLMEKDSVEKQTTKFDRFKRASDSIETKKYESNEMDDESINEKVFKADEKEDRTVEEDRNDGAIKEDRTVDNRTSKQIQEQKIDAKDSTRIDSNGESTIPSDDVRIDKVKIKPNSKERIQLSDNKDSKMIKIKESEKVKEAMPEKVELIHEKVKTAQEKAKEPISEKVEATPEKVELIHETVKTAQEKAKEPISEKVEATPEKVELIHETVKKTQEKAKEPISEKVEPISEKVEVMPDNVEVMPKKVKTAPEKVKEQMSEKVKAVQEKAKEQISGKVEAMSENVKTTQEKAKEQISEKVEAMPEKVKEPISEKVQTAQEKAKEPISEKVKTAPEKAKEPISEKVQTTQEKSKEPISEKVKTVPEKVKEPISKNINELIPKTDQAMPEKIKAVPEKAKESRPEKVEEPIPEKILEELNRIADHSIHNSKWLQLETDLRIVNHVFKKHLDSIEAYDKFQKQVRENIKEIPENMDISKWFAASNDTWSVPLLTLGTFKYYGSNNLMIGLDRDILLIIKATIIDSPLFVDFKSEDTLTTLIKLLNEMIATPNKKEWISKIALLQLMKELAERDSSISDDDKECFQNSVNLGERERVCLCEYLLTKIMRSRHIYSDFVQMRTPLITKLLSQLAKVENTFIEQKGFSFFDIWIASEIDDMSDI